MLDGGAPSQVKRSPDFRRYIPLSGTRQGVLQYAQQVIEYAQEHNLDPAVKELITAQAAAIQRMHDEDGFEPSLDPISITSNAGPTSSSMLARMEYILQKAEAAKRQPRALFISTGAG